jgi:hypothetical protein
MRVRVLEAGTASAALVLERYPGRASIELLTATFSRELLEDGTGPNISRWAEALLRYRHVADKFDLRRDISSGAA